MIARLVVVCSEDCCVKYPVNNVAGDFYYEKIYTNIISLPALISEIYYLQIIFYLVLMYNIHVHNVHIECMAIFTVLVNFKVYSVKYLCVKMLSNSCTIFIQQTF